MGFRSIRTRLILFFGGLIIIVQALTYLMVNQANTENAVSMIHQSLTVGAGIFDYLNDERRKKKDIARLLSGDFAFKKAYYTLDRNTILSATQNHMSRVSGADVMMVVSLDGEVIADTLHPDKQGSLIEWPFLLTLAEKDETKNEASAVVAIDAKPFQMMVVPLLTPEIEAWILVGFLIDDDFVGDQSELIQSDLSIILKSPNQEWRNVASTLAPNLQESLVSEFANTEFKTREITTITLDGAHYISIFTPIIDGAEIQAWAVIKRSLESEMAPYEQLRLLLLGLFAIGLVLSILGAILVARSVSKPIRALVDGVKQIEQGDYTRRVETENNDEVGLLGDCFNSMAKGLEEKEKVRELLGKVVSPEIAEELLKKGIELGGEERVVTVLFSDARNFTALCENRSPKDILKLVNTFLSRTSSIIESHDGVVDKYIGDAVMALFGAPIQSSNDVVNAIDCALTMNKARDGLNSELNGYGLPHITTGIGINTGLVVAGNMGSNTRLNYTVLGDNVNLASRLESLTKVYGVDIIVSEYCVAAAPEFEFRELDRVRVKGKSAAVTLYEPLERRGKVTEKVRAEVEIFHQALNHYRLQQWNSAAKTLAELRTNRPDFELYQLFLSRIEEYQQTPPDPNWDGIYTFQRK